MTKEELSVSRQFLSTLQPKPGSSAVARRKLKKEAHDLDIIIPCFNTQNYVRRCVESVLGQGGKYKVRIIAVDDGATDASGMILDEYSSRDDFCVIHQENKGFSGARNAGLGIVDAKYVSFLDSDDYMFPGTVEKLLDAAISCDAEVAEGFLVHFTDDIDVNLNNFSFEVSSIGKEDIVRFMPGKVYKTELFDDVCFPENYWFEDSILSYLIIPRCSKIVRADMPVYAYRQNPEGISAKSQGKIKSIDSYWIMEMLLEDMKKLDIQIDQDMYEEILDEIALTYVRTHELGINVSVSIFYLTLEWFKGIHSLFTSKNKFQEVLEKGLELENYKTYCDGCAILWNSKLAGIK